jgi:outer membrane protein assembly factor BamA
MQLRKDTVSRCRGTVRGAMLLALFAAASGVARAQDLSCGPGDVEVRALKFEGNKALSDDELALRVTTTPSFKLRRTFRLPLGTKRCLNRAYLPLDVAKLEMFYLERGYYYAKADTVITPMGRGAVGVTFTINEGPVTTLNSYSVTGLSGIPDSGVIMRRLQLRPGQPFNLALFLADLDSIQRHLRNNGYYHAETFRGYDRDSLTASAEVTVVPGTRARFGTPRINVTPLAERSQQVPDGVVRRVIGISPGSWFNDNAITDAQRSLYQLGVYRHVEVRPLPDSLQPDGDSTIVLDVSLSEDYMKRLDSEYGWATLDCGRIRAQYTDQNFLHSARRFEITGQASKIGYGSPVANATTRKMCTFDGRSPLASDSAFSSELHYFSGVAFRQPRLLGTRWTPTVSLYSERRGEYKAYLRSTRIGADASATREIGQRSQLRVGYSQEYGSTRAPDAVLCALFSRCDDASRDEITKVATLGVASASIARFGTDNLVSPTRGSILRAEFRTSASAFLGTSKSLFFHKGSVETAFYRPLIGANVLSFRVRAGAVESPGPFIPPQERLYAGGPSSIRGFQQNELGNAVYIARIGDVVKDSGATIRYHVPDSVGYERVVPLGGNRLFVANLEYRMPDKFILPKLLQYTFFVDAGDVWNQSDRPALKWTPGIGLRLLSPIGPVQVNFGVNSYARTPGPMYFEDPARVAVGAVRPDISPLYCVSPGNTIDLEVRDGVIQPPLVPVPCPDYSPVRRRRWYERLTITFSIGPDF